MLVRARQQLLAAAVAAVAAVATIGPPSPATAAPVSYDYFVNWTSGELAGTTSSGWLSYDSALATPDAEYSDPGLLSGFGFTVRGRTFGLGDVKTGFMSFDHSGYLRDLLVGSRCNDAGCGVGAGDLGAFYLSFAQRNAPNRLDGTIGDPVGMSMGAGDIPSAPVPEPATAALVLLALGAIGAARRGRR